VTKDTEFIRHLPQVMTRINEWSVICDTTMNIPQVRLEPDPATLQNCVVVVYPEVSFPTYDPTKGFGAFVDKHIDLMNAALKYYVLQGAAAIVLPCKVQAFDWNLPLPSDSNGCPWRFTQHVGPAPHNLEYYKIFIRPVVEPIEPVNIGRFQKKKQNKRAKNEGKAGSAPVSSASSADEFDATYPDIALTSVVSATNYLISCNIANSYRNSWFLHRKSINSILESYSQNVVPDFAMTAPLPLKPLPDYELKVVIEGGANVSDAVLLGYYSRLAQAQEQEEAAKDAATRIEDDDYGGDDDMSEGRGEEDGDFATITNAGQFKVEVEKREVKQPADQKVDKKLF